MRCDPAALAGQSFDVAVIGGGMHGAWIAWRAARAGLAVCLLERDDFGGGTSANSLKILHGGLRYLQQFDLARMRRSIAARREYARSFPHLFTPLPCVMPLERTGRRSPWLVAPALLVNELVAIDRNAGVHRQARLPAARILSAAQCLRQMGNLASTRPFAGAMWWDGLAPDTARLVLEVVLAAADAGTQVVNQAQVERILHAGGRVHGVAFTDRLTGRSHEIKARQVVNATGPWAAQLAGRSHLPQAALPVAWTGALNLVLRRCLGHRAAVALNTRSLAGSERTQQPRPPSRELFFVPWQGRTMIGTDYCPVESIEAGLAGPPPDAVATFLRQAAALVPAARLEPADLAHVHWGLMPLAAAGEVLPRRSALLLSEAGQTGADGLVILIGEKLTSAPQVSKRVLAHLLSRAGTGHA